MESFVKIIHKSFTFTCSMCASAIWNFSSGRSTSRGKIGKTCMHAMIKIHTQDSYLQLTTH